LARFGATASSGKTMSMSDSNKSSAAANPRRIPRRISA
jgi:hypothetical protein